jgi:trans-2,3-dihydro-3-hydroxyanthranilate isomerase
VPVRRVTWLDVFTDRPLTGNGLAVVHDAEGLDDATMLAFARETRLSETTFVHPAEVTGADYRNRIFMPTGEVPFAGHPSLGTAVAVARARGQERVTLHQQTVPGVQPVDVEIDGTRARASMLQEPATFGDEVDPQEVYAALGLSPADGDPRLPARIVGCGVPQVLAPVGDPAALDRIVPVFDRLKGIIEFAGALVVYSAWVDPANGRAVARGFTTEAEDPATGSAAGPLMAYVHDRTGAERLEIVQGVAMGRPSLLTCAVEGERVRVGGDVVVLMDGTIHLDT